MKDFSAVVLAAGKGTRMKSKLPKILHPVNGKKMIFYILETLNFLPVYVVIGYQHRLVANTIKKKFPNTRFVIQKNLIGSGNALKQTRPFIKTSYILVVPGDVPFIKRGTLKRLMAFHKNQGISATILTANIDNPFGYGRIIRKDKKVFQIKEERDSSLQEKRIKEINTGIYCFKVKDVFPTLNELKPDNVKKEYYLTDVIKILNEKNKKVKTVLVKNFFEVIGINSKEDLQKASMLMKKIK